MATRIYKVTTPNGVRLIDAAIKTNAIAFVARDEISVEVASGHEIAALVSKGVKVESVSGPGTPDLFEGAGNAAQL